jgi:hypothetical protein
MDPEPGRIITFGGLEFIHAYNYFFAAFDLLLVFVRAPCYLILHKPLLDRLHAATQGVDL